MSKIISLLCISFLLPVYYTGALADNNDSSMVEATMDAGFSEIERQIIERYYGSSDKQSEQEDRDDEDRDGKKPKNKEKNGSKKMPPGLAKKDELPPGLTKQLERNGTLPPGLAKRDLPSDLDRQLPEPKETLERTIVDSSVVLIEEASGRIVDIIADVVTGN